MIKRFLFIFSAVVSLGIPLELSAYPLVYFSEQETWVQEGVDPTVRVVLSEVSFLDVLVPFAIDPASTASIKLEGTAEENDYYILESEDEALGYLFDPVTATGQIIFRPGQTEKLLPIDVDNDLDVEEDETIIFNILSEGLTVARPVTPMQQTVYILDNDGEDLTEPGDVRVELTLEEQTVSEGRSVLFTVSVDSDVEEAIDILYILEYESADVNDIDLDQTGTIPGTINHDGGGGRESVSVFTNKDLEVEAEEEVFYFVLTSAKGVDSGTVYPIGTDRTKVTIIDNDPTNLSWDLFGDEGDENFITLTEGSFIELTLTLDGSLPEDLEIPIFFGGTSIFGSNDDELNVSDFYLVEELPLTIASGGTSAKVTVVTHNDDLIESLETIIVGIGTPVLADSRTVISVEGPTAFEIEVEDNDPVVLNFSRLNPAYDFDDPDTEEPLFIPASAQIVAERDESVDILIYLSAPAAEDLTLDLTLDVAGSTAKSFNLSLPEEGQDWDYLLRYGSIFWDDDNPTQEIPIQAGNSAIQLSLLLNNDEESNFVLGDPIPEDVEEDKTVKFSIGNLQSDSDSVTLGEATSYEVTIKELPDIEVTPLFETINFDPSKWIDGQPKLNLATGLFEVEFDAVPPGSYDADLSGYQSYKVVYDLSYLDLENPDNPSSDPLRTNPSAPQTNQQFEYFVFNPFSLRYYVGVERKVLIEGEEQQNQNTFKDENADTVSYAYYFLRPLSLPALEPEYAEETDQLLYSPEEAFQWNLDFTNSGIATFPVDRLDLQNFPGSVRIFLTAEATPLTPLGGLSSIPILSFKEVEDQSIRLELDTGGNQSIQIQYIGEDGIWRVVQPSIIRTPSTRLFWTDSGPPATIEHPSKTDFRIYKVLVSP